MPAAFAIFFRAALFPISISFLTCAGKPLRRQSFFYIGSITAVVVATYSFRASWLRLTGQRPNPSECARAGVEFVEPKSFGY